MTQSQYPARTSLEFILQDPLGKTSSFKSNILSKHPTHSEIHRNEPSKKFPDSHKLIWIPSPLVKNLNDTNLGQTRCRGFKNQFITSSCSKDSQCNQHLCHNGYQRRARRRFHEIARQYQCTFENCDKSYGALNHLNAHIISKDHGPKRYSWEFKSVPSDAPPLPSKP